MEQSLKKHKRQKLFETLRPRLKRSLLADETVFLYHDKIREKNVSYPVLLEV